MKSSKTVAKDKGKAIPKRTPRRSHTGEHDVNASENIKKFSVLDIDPITIRKGIPKKERQTIFNNKKLAHSFDDTIKIIEGYAKHKNMTQEQMESFNNLIKLNIYKASDQEKFIKKIRANIKKNLGKATGLMQLVFNKKKEEAHFPTSDISMTVAPSTTIERDTIDIEDKPPQPKVGRSVSSVTANPSSISEITQEEEPLSIGAEKEPTLTLNQLSHIKDVIEILNKDPKLKSDIKRTITEELTKGYIKPEQYKKYNEEIEKFNVLHEMPEAIRGTKKNEKSKKSQKKKPKIVTL